METKWLKTFMIAAEHENLRKASEELYLTQPAVTKHIQRLEEYLQVQLFNREGKKISLSVAGARFLPIARAMLAKYEEGMAHFESWKQGYVKQLTIAVAPQIASSLLPAILKRFMVMAPDVEVLINVVNSYEVLLEVEKGQADIGLTRTYSPKLSLQCEVVLEEPVVLVAPYYSDIENEQLLLQNYRLITYNHPVYWDDLLKEIQRNYPAVRTMKVNQIEVTKRFIEHGLGISYLPQSMVEKELQDKQFKMLEPELISPPVSQTYLVYKLKTEEAEAFIHFLKEELGK